MVERRKPTESTPDPDGTIQALAQHANAVRQLGERLVHAAGILTTHVALEAQNQTLTASNARLQRENDDLTARNATVTEQLRTLEVTLDAEQQAMERQVHALHEQRLAAIEAEHVRQRTTMQEATQHLERTTQERKQAIAAEMQALEAVKRTLEDDVARLQALRDEWKSRLVEMAG